MESHHVTALKQGGTPVSPAMSAENVYSWGQWVGHQISNPATGWAVSETVFTAEKT